MRGSFNSRLGTRETVKRAKLTFLAIALLVLGVAATRAGADQRLTAEELVPMALEANPVVRAAHDRWFSASHSIKQTLAPNDPIFSYGSIDSQADGFNHASVHTLTVTEAAQFPGKALLQHEGVTRLAEIARLMYQAAARDLRAQVESGYYQLVLDSSLADVTAENIGNLKRVLQVTQVAYATSQVTQADFIAAEVNLAVAQLLEEQLRTAISNDRTTLNQLLSRRPDEPLVVDQQLRLDPISMQLDPLVALAFEARQEILAAALTEKNSDTALRLARMEVLPDYSLSYIFDHYLLNSAAPAVNRTEVNGFSIAFNLPIFFWMKQNEDAKRAGYDLEAAREDFTSIRNQTAAAVTNIYRSAQLAYRTAQIYRDSLIPLARQGFEVSLVAYQSGKIDFTTLASALQRSNDTRVVYLQAVNQFLAQRVALEQAIGEPFPK